MLGALQRFFDHSEREISRQRQVVEEIAALESEFEALSTAGLADKTAAFRGRLQAGESLDSLLPEAFAAVREAIKRSIGHRLFDVQMHGGIVLHNGQIAEMKTGEGKTYVAALSAYLNALTGNGVHVVTVNDYLSRRDTEWLGPVYSALGLVVGCLNNNDAAYVFAPKEESRDSHHGSGEELRTVPRKEAYGADITYGTNNEFGFDYLRDNMVLDLEQAVQGTHHYAIVDEVDNILIDEARTPLIISGQAESPSETFGNFTRLVPRLREEQDYTIDHKLRAVSITEVGIGKMEKWLGVSNLYEEGAFELVHYMEQALRAQALYQRGRDYVLMKEGRVIEHHDPNAEVVIVDEFTGRLMTGRRYSEGLHQAIEAKEGVKIQRESKTLATITFQNYFRMYDKLAGMTGTAETEADEFRKIYALDVVVVPTNMPMVRQDEPDFVYRTERGKFSAVADTIEEWHKQGAPVLAGTTSIETSEALSMLLKRRGIEHQVLNAKYHEQEAQIVAQAGSKDGVTIATNMAGRGTDIVLGGNPPDPAAAAAVREAGGLHVIGTERHESRRIDNQLRGRSGRQGDLGFSRFYVSLEDELLKRAGSDRVAGIMDRLGMDDDQPIEHNLISKALEQAQTKIEAYNFDLRKHTVEYDDVLNTQRNTIYSERRKVLELEQISDQIQHMVHDEITQMVTGHTAAPPEDWDLEALVDACRQLINQPNSPPAAELEGNSPEDISDRLIAWADEVYAERTESMTPEIMHRVERWVLLRTIDSLWTDHLTAMEDLRTGIGLRAVGQRNPLSEYKAEAYRMFQELTANIQRQTAQIIYRVQAAPEDQPQPAQAMVTNRGEEQQARKPQQARSRQKQGGRKLGRNAPCWCGSGLKFKRCHGR